ncbi:MAG: hypothetical protein V1870_00275 [Candidatus Aenigmatarchaeota archaeon]
MKIEYLVGNNSIRKCRFANPLELVEGCKGPLSYECFVCSLHDDEAKSVKGFVEMIKMYIGGYGIGPYSNRCSGYMGECVMLRNFDVRKEAERIIKKVVTERRDQEQELRELFLSEKRDRKGVDELIEKMYINNICIGEIRDRFGFIVK